MTDTSDPTQYPTFEPFPSISRYARECIITERTKRGRRAPMRWEGGVDPDEAAWLKDANGNYLLSPNTDENISIASPRVRALIEAAPELELAVRALLAYVGEAIDDGWFPKSGDVGPGCYKARQLLAWIEERGNVATSARTPTEGGLDGHEER